MQKPQPEDENFAESSRSLPHSADQKFVDYKQSAEIGTVADMEFVQTHYSPRGVLLLYFRGEAAAEVDKHFNRTFSELCCLPGTGASDNGMESSHWQGLYVCDINLELHCALLQTKNLTHVDFSHHSGKRLQYNLVNQIISDIFYESYRQLITRYTKLARLI